MVELIRVLSKFQDYECKIITMDSDTYFKKDIPDNIEIVILKRRYFKKDLSIIYKFISLCYKYSPDIIHVWGKMAAIYAIPAKILFHIPIINSQISDAIPLQPFYNKIAFIFSNFIIANSHAGLNVYHSPANKSTVIYNGFDFSRLTNLKSVEIIKSNFGIKSKYVVGMVASFSNLKDHTTFIKAAFIILNDFPDTTFLCIGEGNKAKYKNLIPDHFSTNFLFLDSQNDIESIINIFDIGVLATFTEGISNSIIEYMALEKPVVATAGGGTIELIIENETGFLVPQKNENILAERIILLLCDDIKRRIMGKKGRDRIKAVFSIDSMVSKHIDIYNNFSK